MKRPLGEYLMSETASLRSFMSWRGRRFSPSSRIYMRKRGGVTQVETGR